jgi:hypothetical protein
MIFHTGACTPLLLHLQVLWVSVAAELLHRHQGRCYILMRLRL